MNRELKFRSWDYARKKMSYNPIVSDGTDGGATSSVYLNDAILCNEEELMQYTGLKDKNGKEIYEGDIVKCLLATEPEDKGFVCKFKDYRWKFNNVSYPDDDFYGTVNYFYIQSNCEVIGNIFENPELLIEPE